MEVCQNFLLELVESIHLIRKIDVIENYFKNCDLYFCRNASLTELKIVLIITCGLVGEATGCINEGDITCSCC